MVRFVGDERNRVLWDVGVQGLAPALAGGASVQGTVHPIMFARIVQRLRPVVP